MSRMANSRPTSLTSHTVTRRGVLTTGLAAGLALAAPGFAEAVPLDPDRIRTADDPNFHPVQFLLPPPTGRKALGTTALHLVDRSRPDPTMPSGKRELMISLWYPASVVGSAPYAKYMPARTAVEVDDAWTGEYGLALPTGTFDFLHTQTNSRVDAPMQPLPHPVVLFSPGYQYSRFVNTSQVEDLASRGYVVVTMDHTHETPVEFPGGRFLPGVPADQLPDPAFTRTAMQTRTADARFVLDQLERIAGGENPDAEGNDLPPGLGAGLDLDKVGMFGFSLGGYATANTLLEDDRFGAGLNLDGTLQDDRAKGPLGEVARKGLDQPFLLFGSDNSQRTDPRKDGYDKSWAGFWDAQRGWKANLELTGAKQKAFTDFQFVFDQVFRAIYGEDPIISSVMIALVGSVQPYRSLYAQREYIGAFFDQALRRRPEFLLRGDSPKFPEVRFAR
ncbi:platelet-activating factor acetylhydrolase isoform II [Kribbella antiqua]|uniref:Platelet-activating factor acetylhydrolase isoform II n=2 Tax=Kribbella antiqua TaxID=2512217 RepID=A0A4R2IQK2_9ACTN|nr:platelet-activating factor acetylhydrolase isoform II [Kribbella antiqua]